MIRIREYFCLSSKALMTFLVLLNFVFLNLIFSSFFIRVDLSKSGRLRITKSTKNILKNLPDIATIEAFISSDIPESHYVVVKQVKDFLQEYSRASEGQVRLFILDPDSDEDAKSKAGANGIQPSVFRAVSEESANIDQKYFALTIYYGVEKKNILNLAQTPRLEYDLTNAFYKMAYPGSRKIGFISPVGSDFNLQDTGGIPFLSFSSAVNYISGFYDSVSPIDIESEDIPGDIQTLMIPTLSSLGELGKYRIDQFIMKGGNILLLSSGFKINFSAQMQGVYIDDDVIDFYKHYGIVLDKSFLVEPQNFVGIPVNFFQSQPYPAWMLVAKNQINQESLITKGIENLFFPWSGTLSIDPTNFKDAEGVEKITSTVLVKSSSNSIKLSRVTADPRTLLVTMQAEQENAEKGEFNLALHLSGEFSSYYRSKKKPKKDTGYVEKGQAKSHIVAIANPFVFTNSPYSRVQSIQSLYSLNFEFLQSSLDLLFGLEELSSTRTKSVAAPVLDKASTEKQKVFTTLNYCIPILSFLFLGLFKYQSRRKLSRKSYVS